MRKHTITQGRLQDVTHAAVGAVEAARAHSGHAMGSARSTAAHLKDSASQVHGSARDAAAGAQRTAGSLTARVRPHTAGRHWSATLGAAAAVTVALVAWRLARTTEDRERPSLSPRQV
ncbi:hypothetical protein [Streptacidiphilus fuscans]|uniref:Uncharacterized protein n=1 Tax=Streptacidiphilus fuscans TaxID=2789292 RepID=A0A931FBX2_9ACTN|nr:hypothetical protein [Streptacidiphilus fuscans]MBF9069122.1 hypothetical protein [Streptacidiphilus fuscans]